MYQLPSPLPAASTSVFSGKPLRRLAAAALCGIGLLAVAGCGGNSERPALGLVHGRVTLDGHPLKGAFVGFQPKDKGRESFGHTDENGEYELTYLRDIKGAAVGENFVRITTEKNNDPKTETVPLKYNKQTTLDFDVKAGENSPANFDLQSK